MSPDARLSAKPHLLWPATRINGCRGASILTENVKDASALVLLPVNKQEQTKLRLQLSFQLLVVFHHLLHNLSK